MPFNPPAYAEHPGPTTILLSSSSPADFFLLFFDDIIQLITDETKSYAAHNPSGDLINAMTQVWMNFFFLAGRRNSFAPPLLSSNFRGGSTEKKNFPLKSQLMPLATFVPSLGRVGQCAWELCCSILMKCFFWSDPCVF